jgi:hypothetical protein
MNCEALAEIIVDMARGAAVPGKASLGARRHIETCASCAAEYVRQRDLTTALQTLAAEAQDWKAPAAMEHRLLAAFAPQRGHDVAMTAGSRSNLWRYALAAAAVVLAVWGIREAGKPGPQKPRSAELPRAVPAPVSPERSVATAPASKPAFATAPADKPALAGAPAGKPAVAKAAAGKAATSVEFVRIPSAIGLPELESGTVLRMELPLTALPEYGLEIAPDAVRTSVEADILVGQDGQPRAIRLIEPDGVAQDPRSRQ